jgi:hypothetical protein
MTTPDADLPDHVRRNRKAWNTWAVGYGDWIRLLRANGFEIENLVELYPAEGANAIDFPYATNEWAR